MNYKAFIITILSFITIGITSCSKDEEIINVNNFVGIWSQPFDEYSSNLNLRIEDNGEYSYSDYTNPLRPKTEIGVLTPKKDRIIFNPNEGESYSRAYRLFAKKSILIFLSEKDDVPDLLLCKDGTYKNEGIIENGRWDAPIKKTKPENLNSVFNEYYFSLIINDNKADFYNIRAGFHIKGNYSFNNGVFKFQTPEMWQGIYRTQNGYRWREYGSPGESKDQLPGQYLVDAIRGQYDFNNAPKEYIYDGVMNMNPQTFEIKKPWQLEEGDPFDYYQGYESFKLFISDDGKEAYYFSSTGTVIWLFKR